PGYPLSLHHHGGNDLSARRPTLSSCIPTVTTWVDALSLLDALPIFHQPLASLGDYVWNDVNVNGIQDGSESGVAGVTVNLYRPGYGPDGSPNSSHENEPDAAYITEAKGKYSFTNLIPGDYHEEFELP